MNKCLIGFIRDHETPPSDPLFPQETPRQHFATLPPLAVSYYLHAFLIPRILCVRIAGMWQASPRSQALPMRHPAPSFLSQACSGHNVLAAASSAQSPFCTNKKRCTPSYDSISCERYVNLQQFTDSLMFLMFSCLALTVGGRNGSACNANVRISASVSDQAAATFWRGGRGSRESRIGLGAFEFRSSVFKFPLALLSQFPQHPDKHRTTNLPIKC